MNLMTYIRNKAALKVQRQITGSQLYDAKVGLDAVVRNDVVLSHAIQEIKNTYGVDTALKGKSILKFGRSEQVQSGQYCTLFEAPTGIYNETYVASDLIINISSSNAGDTQDVSVEGHTLSGGNLTFVSQTATLNGQNKVVLTTPLARVSRIRNIGSTDFAGDIYVYENDTITAGVPDTSALVHLMAHIADGGNQSFKAATSISSTDYWVITSAFASLNSKSGNPVAEVRIEVSPIGGVFTVSALASLATLGSTSEGFNFGPAVIVPSNYDIRMRAKASANGIDISGWLNGYLLTTI